MATIMDEIINLAPKTMDSVKMNGTDTNGAARESLSNGITEKLYYVDEEHHSTTMSCLNTLRKSGEFCDVTLEVGSHEITGHRAVLASASSFLLELFSLDEASPRSHFKLPYFSYPAFEVLVNYVYTGKLEVPPELVKSVYKTAMRLKIFRAAKSCSTHLARHLNPGNCIGIRSFASGHSDASLIGQCDEYILENNAEVATSKECISLPRIQVEIIGADNCTQDDGADLQLYNLVIEWARSTIDDTQSWETITDHVNVLFLNPDNTLSDCKDIDDNTLNSEEYIQDYKKLTKKRQVTPMKSKDNGHRNNSGNSLPRKLKLISGDLEDKTIESEWRVIAIHKTSEKKHMCIAILDDSLATISIHHRPAPVITNGNGEASGQSSPETSPRNITAQATERQMSLVPLCLMSSPRSGVGVAIMDDKIVAIGGYDRGECLKSVEMYDIRENKWSPLPDMKYPRGRFDATHLNGRVFACGGSDGSRELNSMEYYDNTTQKWCQTTDMKRVRVSCGMSVLEGKLYCVGGISGQGGLKSVEVFDPDTQEWDDVANMLKRRSEPAVCVHENLLYAIGGSNGWTCQNTVEVYNPIDKVWKMLPPMSTNRRGAGVAPFNGKLYVVGGSDGNLVQNSVEIFDPETQTWSSGPQMTTPRVNVGITVHMGRLFAIGGFSGKHFLDTIEYLDLDLNEWCSYLPTEYDVLAKGSPTS